jgi:hypothetical protein
VWNGRSIPRRSWQKARNAKSNPINPTYPSHLLTIGVVSVKTNKCRNVFARQQFQGAVVQIHDVVIGCLAQPEENRERSLLIVYVPKDVEMMTFPAHV